MEDPTPQELETPDPSEETEPGTSEPEAELFSEKFDPATLPPELRERYDQMNGDYTRKTQSLAEQRREAEEAIMLREALQDEELRREFFYQLAAEQGIALPQDEEAEEDDDDDFEFKDPRVDELIAEREAEKKEREVEQQRKEAEELEQTVRAEMEKQAKASKLPLTEKTGDWLYDRIINLGIQHGDTRTESEIVGMAMGELQTILDGHLESVKQSKQEAPTPPLPPGTSPTPTPTGDTDKARRQRALEVANRSFANSQ